jgi:hypothetical protein
VQGYFSIAGGEMDLRLTAETPETLAALEGGQDALRAMLAEAGVTEARLSFKQAGEPRRGEQAEGKPAEARVRQVLSEYEYVV